MLQEFTSYLLNTKQSKVDIDRSSYQSTNFGHESQCRLYHQHPSNQNVQKVDKK